MKHAQLLNYLYLFLQHDTVIQSKLTTGCYKGIVKLKGADITWSVVWGSSFSLHHVWTTAFNSFCLNTDLEEQDNSLNSYFKLCNCKHVQTQFKKKKKKVLLYSKLEHTAHYKAKNQNTVKTNLHKHSCAHAHTYTDTVNRIAWGGDIWKMT